MLAALASVWPGAPLAAAEAPVRVVLGGTGAASWNISGVAPGDSGTKSVSVQNAGTGAGELRIWLSSISGTEGTPLQFETPTPGDTGELGQYLRLKVAASGLASDVTMPALLGNFPASAGEARYIKYAAMGAGQTLNLTWTWNLPADTGNIVQGDGISFTINYTLSDISTPPATEPPPVTTHPPVTTAPPVTTIAPPATTPVVTAITTIPATTAPPQPVTTEPIPTTPAQQNISIKIFGGNVAQGTLSPEGVLLENIVAVSNDGDIILAFPAGLLMATDDGDPIAVVDVTIFDGAVPTSAGQAVIGHIYSLTGYDVSGHATNFKSDHTFYLSLPYSPSLLPDGAKSVYAAYFDPSSGKWEQLPTHDNGQTNRGHIQAELTHFSLFAVMADTQQVTPLPAAAFEIGNPVVQPSPAEVNKPVTISAVVINTGNANGEFVVRALIPGLLDSSQLVVLAPGASQELSFTVIPRAAGNYTVDINGRQANLVVSEKSVATGGIRAYIHAHLDSYIGFSIVVLLALMLTGSIMLGARKSANPS